MARKLWLLTQRGVYVSNANRELSSLVESAIVVENNKNPGCEVSSSEPVEGSNGITQLYYENEMLDEYETIPEDSEMLMEDYEDELLFETGEDEDMLFSPRSEVGRYEALSDGDELLDNS